MFSAKLEATLFISNLVLVFCTSVPEVKLKQGVLRGIYEESNSGWQVASFWGIPYAEPPVGEHRFKEAVPASEWPGIYNANQPGPNCMQYDHIYYKTEFAVNGNEDCLYLNVFTPRIPRNGVTEEKLDVIVYIHGGAWLFSGGHHYGFKFLLDKDVVFVTINYRLGPLGFLSTEDDLIPGNNGLKDQVLALRWVQENIAAFGGDPDSVTIAGMSAGGASIHYHMLSPLSKGLFKAAISASGTALCPWAQTENLREKTFKIATELGCPLNSSLMVECLRKRPAHRIVGLTKEFMTWMYNPFSPFGPVVEKSSPTAFIDKTPLQIIREGKINDVPWMVSFTDQEGLYPAAEIICNYDAYKFCTDNWTKLAPALLDFEFTAKKSKYEKISSKIWSHYFGKNKNAAHEDIVKMFGDRMFYACIFDTLEAHARVTQSPIHVYKFSYRGKNSLSEFFCESEENYGASHADDTAYVLETEYLATNESEEDKRMVEAMTELWYSFATTGKPKFGTSDWPELPVNARSVPFLHIQSPDRVDINEESKDISNSEFWESLGLNENKLSDSRVKDEF